MVTVEPVLTAILPVYNGGEEIVDNVGVIRRALADGLPGEDVEVIVVSDGSIDETAEQLLAARGEVGFRVIHYDRNLGKGYAVKAGPSRHAASGWHSSMPTSISTPRLCRSTSRWRDERISTSQSGRNATRTPS